MNAVSYCEKRDCIAMVDQLVPLLLKLLFQHLLKLYSEQEWLKISKLFEKRWYYTHAFGATDGKHATVIKPKNVAHFTAVMNMHTS